MEIRRARAEDQQAITALVRGAKLNPAGLHWEGFVVAEQDGRLVGVVQLRRHPDSATEMASLVIDAESRGQGIAARMFDLLLADETGPVHAVLDRRHLDSYARWGFGPIDPGELPKSVARTLRIGRVVTAIASVIRRDRIRLVPVYRPPSKTA